MREGQHIDRQKTALKKNAGMTLIELIVSMLVSSVVVLSAVAFFSFSMSQSQKTSEETDLMMEAQIGANLMKEVLMEAKEPLQTGIMNQGGVDYPWFLVITEPGISDGGDEELVHLFLQDTEKQSMLYYRGTRTLEEPESLVNHIFFDDGRLDLEDYKRWFFVEHVKTISVHQPMGGKLIFLEMLCEAGEREHVMNETIRLRNESAILLE